MIYLTRQFSVILSRACAKVTIPGGGFKTRVEFCHRFEVVKQLEGRICGDKEKNSE